MTLGSDPASDLRQLPWWQQALLSPAMLLVVWLLLQRFRTPITNGLSRLGLPGIVTYLAIGLPFTAFGNTVAMSFGWAGPDFHPNLLLNGFFWFGAFGGLLLGWYALRYVYAFGVREVFLFTGLVGLLVEQDQLVPKTLLAGDVVTTLVLSAYLVPLYGIMFASPWLVMPPEQLPRGARRPGLGAALLFTATPTVCFYLGAFLWFTLTDTLLGTRFLSS